MTRHGRVVLALLASVTVVDQAAKWWAWRHAPGAMINPGGDILVGRTIGAWYAGPVSGALLDMADFGLLGVLVLVLTRCRAVASIAVPATLVVGGWTSNLLDRLGTHYWTAPGSIRGVVDFVDVGGRYYNLADFFIIGGTPLVLLAAGYQGVRAARRASPGGSLPRPVRAGVRARVPKLIGAGLVLAVVLGAANYGATNYGGVAAPRAVTGQGRSGLG